MNLWKESNKNRGNGVILIIGGLGLCIIAASTYLYFTGRIKTGGEKTQNYISEQFDNLFDK